VTLMIFQFDEDPVIIEEVQSIELEGDDVIVTSATDGRTIFNMNDIVKGELVQ